MLIGASGCEMVHYSEEEAFKLALVQHKLRIDSFGNYFGGAAALAFAREVIAERPLPDDLTLRVITAQSDPADLEDFAKVALSQGVLPPDGAVMRGIDRPGFAMLAYDADGAPVATAGAAMSRHPDDSYGDMAQWGQLATIDARKGQGIARAMAAHSIIHCFDVLGAKRISTGIRVGNAASEKLCTSMGLELSPYRVVLALDPESFASKRVTT